MRKQLFWMAAAIVGTTMSLSSCSSSEDILSADLTQAQEEADAQIIKIGVTNSGDNFGTRAAVDHLHMRQLRSAEAKQKIQFVKSLIIKLDKKDANQAFSTDIDDYNLANNGTIVKDTLIDNWNSDNHGVLAVTNGRQAVWKLTGTNKLAQGIYAIYSVGSVPQAYGEVNTFENYKAGDELSMPRYVTKSDMDSQNEIFAGLQVFEVNASGQVQATVNLQRQVAGALGYFTKIPVVGDHFHATTPAKYLRLVSNGISDKLMFSHFNDAFQNKMGQNQAWVMNGCLDGSSKGTVVPATAAGKYYNSADGTYTDNGGYIVYTIDLSKWFTADANGSFDIDGNGVLDKDDNWKNGMSDETEVAVRRGSVLNGNFIFPFEAAPALAANSTFQLQLLDEHENPIRAWNVTLATGDSQRTNDAIKVKEDNTTETVAHPTDATGYGQFLVLRNHLYSIGKRTSDKPTVNPDDPDPDPNDPDYPQDLTKETLQMVVMSSWEENHVMDVE